MPKFKVIVDRHVRQWGEVTVEADTPDDAMKKINRRHFHAVKWRDGDEPHPSYVWAAVDTNGRSAWLDEPRPSLIKYPSQT